MDTARIVKTVTKQLIDTMKNRIFIYRNSVTILLTDVFLIALAWYAAHLLRFNFDLPMAGRGMVGRILPGVVLLKLVVFYFFHLYQGMWRYTSITDLINILKACIISTFIIVCLFFFSHRFEEFSRSVFIIDCALTILAVSGARLILRLFFEIKNGSNDGFPLRHRLLNRHNIPKDATKLLIIGAGNSGEKIHREIRDNPRLKYWVVGYLDDDYTKQHKMIHGIPVLGRVNQLDEVSKKVIPDEVLIAVPSASAEQMRTIVDCCKHTDLKFKTLPGLGELINGRVSINAVRDVAYRDLLGRSVVHLEEERIDKYLNNNRVLVTGAGGSIGSELCRQICRFRPKLLVLFEQAESSLYDIDLELKREFPYVKVVPVLGDIRNRSRLERTFQKHSPIAVFHAAAYKHVPMLEIQPWEAVLNNIHGTRNVVEVARKHKVQRFVMVSTDKAVRPTNIMGTTKRVAELMVQCQKMTDKTDTRFITVRFGNVVGSVGSVVPLFKKQIEKGGPVTITHPEVTRYFMTIPEASQLILQAGAMGKGGETYILKMGTSIKIVDMARDLIRLSGFEPDVDIKIEFIGLRPGEKLYEELITEGEGIVPTSHDKIMVLAGQACNLSVLNQEIDEIIQHAKAQDDTKIRTMLKKMVPEYDPDGLANDKYKG